MTSTEQINTEWRDVVGYEGIYKISKCGKVMRTDSGRIRKPSINSEGYYCVSFYNKGKQKTLKLHRIIAHAFMGVSDLFVNHRNGIKTDNRLENLEYITSRENRNHYMRDKGKFPRGVAFDQGKYKVNASVNGKITYFGSFDSAEAAHEKYMQVITGLEETKYSGKNNNE